MEFLRLFQTHLHKNIFDKLRIAILVLLAFCGWYVGLWRIGFLDEFGGVERFSLSYSTYFWWKVVLLFLLLIIVEVILIPILTESLLLLRPSFIIIPLILLFG